MRWRWILLLFLLALSASAWACNVPVFHYALQWWEPDAYRVIVFHEKPLGDSQGKVLQKLREMIEKSAARAEVEVIDLSAKPDSVNPTWVERVRKEGLPRLMLAYPESSRSEVPAWSGDLTMSGVEALLDSPMRRAVVKELVSGAAGVWLFLPCGDASADRKFKEELEGTLRELEKTTTLPENMAEGLPPDKAQVAEQLEKNKSVRFPVLTVDPANQGEVVFRQVLLNAAFPGEKQKSPAVIPIFGRGRALTVMEGEAMKKINVSGIVDFLAGACSCEVKSQNPGVDLFFAVDWNSLVEHDPSKPLELPPLFGPTATPEVTRVEEVHPLSRNLVWMGAGVGVILLGATVWILRRKKG